MEEVIPIKIDTLTFRYECTTYEQNQVVFCHELDLADERRERALVRTTAYQQKIAQHLNSK